MDDTISRAKAIEALDKRFDSIPMEQTSEILMLRKDLRNLPSAQPEIIYCKDCRKHNKKIGFDENFHTVWKDACPLVSWRGKAQGYEFDYQFCAYAKRREVTT